MTELSIAKEDCDILQNDLQTLSEWEQTWGTEFHPQKCSVLRVTRKRGPIEHKDTKQDTNFYFKSVNNK
ncbi:hypothetical protein DPMN_069048 [Dreissena polymorpha]|uniref:Uncharacterized protein n=1 Tax=Dreissena polymorpha TaxID=45954 RepID=A0A9D3Z0U1_DREPO|nr:hypothetical protein DPMN_069048 [Dreissena polymorpha]